MITQAFGTPQRVTADTLLRTGSGVLLGMLCNSTSSGTVTLYDATSATGTAFAAFTPSAATFYPLPATFNTGLYFVKTNTIDVTFFVG